MRQKKLTRKDKVELSKSGICWKCGGALEKRKEGRNFIHLCSKCEDKKILL
jgi:hypothetical protein